MAAVRHPSDPVNPGNGTGLGRHLLFHVVPEEKTSKNRIHLDLCVGSERIKEECAGLEALGVCRLSNGCGPWGPGA